MQVISLTATNAMPNPFGFKKDYQHRELSDFSFDKGINPRIKKNYKLQWIIALIVLFLLAFCISHFTKLTTVEPVHAAEVQMSDKQVYELYDGQTKTLCKNYLKSH